MSAPTVQIDVRWQETWLGGAWKASVGTEENHFYFGAITLHRALRNLSDARTADRFYNSLYTPGLSSWWKSICGGVGNVADKNFRLCFPAGVWDLPWELMIGDLPSWKYRAAACMTRCLLKSRNASPNQFDDKLRVLVLLGNPMKGTRYELDLSKEAQVISDAYDGLETEIKARVASPAVANVTRANFVPLMEHHRPNLLWFGGHGSSRGGASLLLSNPDGRPPREQDWINASDFADLIRKSGIAPLYAVFLACNTARPVFGSAGLTNFPALFEQLANADLLSMLAMQAPLQDRVGVSFAEDLFRYLASGFTLEFAAARARANILERQSIYAHYQWAIPVVWSTGPADRELAWNSPIPRLAQLQLTGRLSLGVLPDGSRYLTNHSLPAARSRAAAWLQTRRLWISTPAEESKNQHHAEFSGELQLLWISILREIQQLSSEFVLAIDLKSNDPVEEMAAWAGDLLSRLLPTDIPPDIGKLLESFTRPNQAAAWEKLCRFEHLRVAISNPPSYTEWEWFWKPLRASDLRAKVIVLSAALPAESLHSHWDIDVIGECMSNTPLDEIINANREVANVLAILNRPVATVYLEAAGISLRAWAAGEPLIIDTAAGPILPAFARKTILDKMTPRERVEADLRCCRILSNPQLPPQNEWTERKMSHFLDASRQSETLTEELDDDALRKAAATEADLLCEAYYHERRPYAILDVVNRLGDWEDLKERSRLRIAWAHVSVGQTEIARIWLLRCNPDGDLLELAWKHGLQAEVHKADGEIDSKQQALAEITHAITLCEQAIADGKDELALQRHRQYRQDRARILQYLFYDSEAAIREYELLREELAAAKDGQYDLALVKRNYAECLRSTATPFNNRFQEGKALIMEAYDAVKDRYAHTNLLPEILYEVSVYAGQEGNAESAKEYLKMCQRFASSNRYFMMLAIANSRFFWKYEALPFDESLLDQWVRIESDLDGYQHGWAVRALIDGRLRVARFYYGRGDFRHCSRVLESVLAVLESRPSFNAGSDRSRIGVTFAGMHMTSQSLGPSENIWNAFIAKYSWAEDWVAATPGLTPVTLWRAGRNG